MVRHSGLDQRTARQCGAPAAADDLRHQAEHAFIGAEPLPEQQRINAQNTHEGNFFKVKPLGNHLRTQQDIVLVPGKLRQHRFVGVFLAGGVLIHPQNAGVGQKLGQFFLDALSAKTAVVDLAAALGAEYRQRMHRVAAVVAHQRLLRLVVNQRHAAIGAFQHMATIGTHADGAIAATVQKQDALLAVIQVFLQFARQAAADFPRVACGELSPHIKKIHARQRAAAIAVGQGDKFQFTALGGVVSLGQWRGRGKE